MIIEMPLNSIPPTVAVAALDIKRKVAQDQAYVDVGFWGRRHSGQPVRAPRPARRRGVRLQMLPWIHGFGIPGYCRSTPAYWAEHAARRVIALDLCCRPTLLRPQLDFRCPAFKPNLR